MVVDTNKENININKLICEKEEFIDVEGDMIVPDSKPDILSAINTSGNICIYKKELADERVKIDGSINAYVMYIADNAEDKVRGINMNLDFSKTIDVPNCNGDMLLSVTTEMKTIECNVINGRKINVKASICVKLKVYADENVDIITDVLNNADIQVLKSSMSVNSLVGCGSTKAYIKDTINIDNSDNLKEILKVSINMVDRDIKTSFNKVLAKTEADIKIVYLTDDNRIAICNNKIPIVGFIDIQNVSENNICDTNFEMKNMVIKPNNIDEHSIYIELEIEASCMAYEEKEIHLLQDLYSPTQNINCNKKNYLAMTKKQNRTETFHVNDEFNIHGLNEGELINAECMPRIANTNKLNSKILFEGEVEISLIFGSMDIGINTSRVIMPFEFTVNDIESGENLDIVTNLEVKNQDFTIKSDGEVVTNLDISINMNLVKNEAIEIIDEVEMNENRSGEDYSLIIYIVKSGDTLWEIAKKFGSTVEDIVKANAIENENKITVGEKLYIPKYTKMYA